MSPTTSVESVAVVVPVYRRDITKDELLSLRHLDHYLPDVDCFLAMPDGLDFERSGFRPVRFRPSFFASLTGYNRLVLSTQFYECFRAYEYILIHQLDAIILSSDLQRFLSMNVDYLGAPFVDYSTNGTPFLTGVGNGGLSLRRVSAFRRLLESRTRTTTARAYFAENYAHASRGSRMIGLCKAGLKGLGIRNSIKREIDVSLSNEDSFIAAVARKYSPGFAVGSISQALEFAFEREPRYCYERAGRRMPLGAHAWTLYDRAFWEPHLLA